jgi:hypothetical protein
MHFFLNLNLQFNLTAKTLRFQYFTKHCLYIRCTFLVFHLTVSWRSVYCYSHLNSFVSKSFFSGNIGMIRLKWKTFWSIVVAVQRHCKVKLCFKWIWSFELWRKLCIVFNSSTIYFKHMSFCSIRLWCLRGNFFQCHVFTMKSVQNLKSFWRSSQNFFVLALFSSLYS